MTDYIHIIKTQEYGDEQHVMFCGATRDVIEEPDSSLPVCSDCLLAVLNLLKHRQGETATIVDFMAEQMDRHARLALDRYDSATLRIERLERWRYKAVIRLSRLQRRLNKVRKHHSK